MTSPHFELWRLSDRHHTAHFKESLDQFSHNCHTAGGLHKDIRVVKQQTNNNFATMLRKRIRELEREVKQKGDALSAGESYWAGKLAAADADAESKTREMQALKKVIVSLNDQIKDLSAHNQTHEATIAMLKKEKADLKKMNDITLKRHEGEKDKLKKQVRICEERINSIINMNKNMVSEKEQDHAKEKADMQATCDKLEQQCRETDLIRASLSKELKGLTRKHQGEVEKVKKDTLKKEEELKVTEETLNGQITTEQMRVQRLKDDLADQKEKYEMITNDVYSENIRLIRRTDDLEERNRILQRKPDLNPLVASLRETIQTKNTHIKNKGLEISRFQSDLKHVKEKYEQERIMSAVSDALLLETQRENEDLKEKLKKEMLEHKKAARKLSLKQRLCEDLEDKIKYLQGAEKRAEPVVKSLQDKNSLLEITVQRLKEGLQACVSVVTEPRELKARVITLKERYLDEKCPKWLSDDETPEEMQCHINRLTKQLYHAKNAMETLARTIETKDKHIAEIRCHLNQTESHLIQELNHKIKDSYNCRKVLEETTRKLEKATKPATQKIRSWINKKVLRSNKVVPAAEEEPPELYPEDWQLPGCPNVTPTSDEMTPSQLPLAVSDHDNDNLVSYDRADLRSSGAAPVVTEDPSLCPEDWQLPGCSMSDEVTPPLPPL